jgi:two-component system, cell cycle sensor histidine kinase and response regulator CckA
MTETKTEPKRILIVDDEPVIVQFVDRVLRGAGYVTSTAGSGVEALQVAETAAPYDLVVADVNMPGISGPDLIGRLRMRQPDLRVLYLTGYNDQLFAERNLLWEGEAFLDKPATIDGLLQAVSLMLFGNIQGGVKD